MALLVALCGLLFAPPVAYPQRTLASLQVLVQDPSGAVIPGAQLELLNVETQLERRGETDAAGVFSFISLEPGRYDMTGTVPGLETQ
jgi:hypothetical protein